MEIDLTPILSGEVTRLPFEITGTLSDSIWGEEVTFPEPIRASGAIKNMAGYMQITLDAFFVYETACARCLAPIRRECKLTLEKGVCRAGDLGDEENEEYLTYEGRVLSLDEALGDLFYMNLPYRHLCREDCKGYCPDCGKDLNQGPCNCTGKTVDPRLAVLAQLLTEKDE